MLDVLRVFRGRSGGYYGAKVSADASQVHWRTTIECMIVFVLVAVWKTLLGILKRDFLSATSFVGPPH